MGEPPEHQPTVADPYWYCPNCGADGALMDRSGSKDTCATCLWVVDGKYNEYEMKDFDLTFRQARQLLVAMDEPWHGTPGDIGTRLYHVFWDIDRANRVLASIREGDDA